MALLWQIHDLIKFGLENLNKSKTGGKTTIVIVINFDQKSDSASLSSCWCQALHNLNDITPRLVTMAHKCQTTCRALLCSYCLQHEFECWCTGVVRFQKKTEGTWLVTTMMIVISEVQMHRSTRWVLGSETTMPCNVRSRCDSFPPLTPCTLCTAKVLAFVCFYFQFCSVLYISSIIVHT